MVRELPRRHVKPGGPRASALAAPHHRACAAINHRCAPEVVVGGVGDLDHGPRGCRGAGRRGRGQAAAVLIHGRSRSVAPASPRRRPANVRAFSASSIRSIISHRRPLAVLQQTSAPPGTPARTAHASASTALASISARRIGPARSACSVRRCSAASCCSTPSRSRATASSASRSACRASTARARSR